MSGIKTASATTSRNPTKMEKITTTLENTFCAEKIQNLTKLARAVVKNAAFMYAGNKRDLYLKLMFLTNKIGNESKGICIAAKKNP